MSAFPTFQDPLFPTAGLPMSSHSAAAAPYASAATYSSLPSQDFNQFRHSAVFQFSNGTSLANTGVFLQPPDSSQNTAIPDRPLVPPIQVRVK